MMQRIFNKFSGQCGFLGGSLVKNTPVNAGDAVDVGPLSGLGRPPKSREWQTTPVFLTGKCYEQRTPVG